MEVNKSMERLIQHFSHNHLLFLRAEEHKIDDADHSEIQMACCSSPYSGPIYSCEACGYFLHKVCAELPIEMNFHMHPKHTLTLLSKTTYNDGAFECNMCNQSGVKFVYNCSICSFDVDLACASAAQTIEDICHQHPLYPIQVPASFYCHFCGSKDKGLSYKCNICPFWIHQNCTVLVTDTVKHSHHQHPLTFLQSVPIEYETISRYCGICRDLLPMFHCVYYCDGCKFFAHVSCARSEITWSSVSRNYGTEKKWKNKQTVYRQIQHFSHEHPLFLKAKEHKIDDADHSEIQMACCSTSNSGPIYCCEACGYFLHKVCAELPNKMNFPMHPKHTLTLLSKPTYRSGDFRCNMCRQFGVKFVYNCSICSFNVDLVCASAAQTIEDICHHHPLYPIQVPSSFYCHFCRIENKGLSYKCNICPFWVHQNCTLLVTHIVNDRYHWDPLTFLQSVPIEYDGFSSRCDICYDVLPAYCVYYCGGCMFFAHASCVSKIKWSSVSRIRDQDVPTNGAFLPLKPNSTNFILWFMEDNIDLDANIPNKIDHFDHKRPLFFVDKHLNEEICRACAIPICRACAIPITTSSYGCRECRYFLHKCCTELPKQISHSSHPHDLSLCNGERIFKCDWCSQWCNGFCYKCLVCETFEIDIKCCLSSLMTRPVHHLGHRHPLIPRLLSSLETCSECNGVTSTGSFLHCETCIFKVCLICAMSPPTMKHRWDKHPFELTFSPPKNHHNEYHYNEYYCILCEEDLNPKRWFYFCSPCDQFAHVRCMLSQSADSNIRYGESYEYEDHEHPVTLIDCTYNTTICDLCRHPLKRDLSIGLECKECDFNFHLVCPTD